MHSLSHQYDLFMTTTRQFVALLCCALFGLSSQAASTLYSDILLDIVQHCVDTSAAHYCQQCRAPTLSSVCSTEKTCQKTTDVWAMNAEFVAIRDIKMCGCPTDFVHGLVLPREVVTGVEDPRRPLAIWAYAWQVGLTRLDAASLVLVINPQQFRSQNQMHIHVLRFKPHAQQALSAFRHLEVSDLNDVWQAASKLALAQSFPDYGVLVSLAASGRYQVVVTPDSPEKLFTQYVCDKP